jgi:hypothetical protein
MLLLTAAASCHTSASVRKPATKESNRPTSSTATEPTPKKTFARGLCSGILFSITTTSHSPRAFLLCFRPLIFLSSTIHVLMYIRLSRIIGALLSMANMELGISCWHWFLALDGFGTPKILRCFNGRSRWDERVVRWMLGWPLLSLACYSSVSLLLFLGCDTLAARQQKQRTYPINTSNVGMGVYRPLDRHMSSVDKKTYLVYVA